MKISGVFFGIVIVAFLLPFMVVTCNGQKIGSASGLQMIMGVKTDMGAGDLMKPMQKSLSNLGSMFGESLPQEDTEPSVEKTPMNIPALIALLMAIVGLITAVIMKPKMFFVPLGAAIVGIITLILLTSNAKSGLSGLGMELQGVSVKPQFGYYLAFIGFILAGVFTLVGFKMGHEKVEYQPSSGFNPPPKPDIIPPVAGEDNQQSFFERAKDFVEDKIEDAGELVEKVKDKVDIEEVKDKIADNVNFDKVEDGLAKVIGKDTAETVVDKVEDFVKPDEEPKG